jgi:hypothetical protein
MASHHGEGESDRKSGVKVARIGKWAGVGAFAFFLIKGLAWLIVPAAIAALATANP